MNPLLALLTIVLVSGIAIAILLVVRRRAPEGSYFSDGDRASGGFGVLATGFSVLLGLIVFLAFSSYDQSRAGAEAEALAVAQQFETAQLLPKRVREPLGDQLVCYARSVVGQEWPRMKSGESASIINPWAVRLFRTAAAADPQTNTEQSAFDKWLDRTADREEARRDRIHGAAGVIPTPLWVVLFFIALVIFAYMLFFADSAERAVSQAMLMGSVMSVIVALLLLIQFLDTPYRSGPGGLKPTAMTRTLVILDHERSIVGAQRPLPCDGVGRPPA